MLVEFLWRVSQDIQRDANDSPMAPDVIRWQEYAMNLCDYLHIDNEVGFEDITLVVSPITPIMTNDSVMVEEHQDVMNDDLSGYSRTCVLNLCFATDTEVPFLMQVIGNFRKVVGQQMVPFRQSLLDTIANAKCYVKSWQKEMQTIFANVSTNTRWDPFDRLPFFLDDQLPFKTMTIFSPRNDQEALFPIEGEYLLTVAGLSRVISFSMFIDPIMKVKERLATDQRIELLFFACLLTNPLWFHHVVCTYLKEPTNTFGKHPMYDIVREFYLTFGTWQGGPHGRWSPCGGTTPVVELFGAHPSATPGEISVGTERLKNIVGVLFRHLEWINSLQCTRVVNPMTDLPTKVIQKHWESIRKDIHDIVPCQFSLFRLSVFTTLAIGCNELRHGPHLKQLMIPIRGTGAYKHSLGECSYETPHHHDRLMTYLSNAMGRTRYVRDEMECLLCESNPNRNACCDWFTKGQNIYDCTDEGIIVYRSYGKTTEWLPVGPPQEWTYRFADTQNVPRRDEQGSIDMIVNQFFESDDDESSKEKQDTCESPDANSSTGEEDARDADSDDECTSDKESTSEEEAKTSAIRYRVDESLRKLAHSLGKEMRQKQQSFLPEARRGPLCRNTASESYVNPFTTRGGQISGLPDIHHYRSVNMYSRDYYHSVCKVDIPTKGKMIVLGDAETAKEINTEVNAFEDFVHGSALLDFLQMRGLSDSNNHHLKAGCIHQESYGDGTLSRITYFPGHKDKVYIDRAMFIPLSGREFFTYVSVPTSWNIVQDNDSMAAYELWLSGLSEGDVESVRQCHHHFVRDSAKFMMNTPIRSLIFWNKLGSLLEFPSSQCFHGTLIPAGQEGTTLRPYRDLLILHPFVLDTVCT